MTYRDSYFYEKDSINNKMVDVNFIKENEQQFKRIMLMYNSALKEIETKVSIISDEFQMLYKYNPIEHIKTMFEASKDINVIEKKDYIKNPKESGYSSYHLIASVPVSFTGGIVDVNVEIQIRTIAMDFWASLEHKIKYKYSDKLPKNISKELKDSAKMVAELDNKMSKLGRNLIDEFEHDVVANKVKQIEGTKLLES